MVTSPFEKTLAVFRYAFPRLFPQLSSAITLMKQATFSLSLPEKVTSWQPNSDFNIIGKTLEWATLLIKRKYDGEVPTAQVVVVLKSNDNTK